MDAHYYVSYYYDLPNPMGGRSKGFENICVMASDPPTKSEIESINDLVPKWQVHSNFPIHVISMIKIAPPDES